MPSNNVNKASDLPATLFPHSYMPESSIKKILSFMGSLTICQPWLMERPSFLPEEDFSSIRILNPSNNLNPGEGLKTLLSEYYEWIEQHNKNYADFLKASQEKESSDNTTWEIRQMLRRMGQKSSVPEENHSFRWHLILHLAREYEYQRQEADRILKLLKEKKSPLKGVIEEADKEKSPLEDLPKFESDSITDEHHLRQIFEAWFSLFGEHLKDNELLVTSDHHIMDYVSELLEESGDKHDSTHEQIIQFRFPDLSQYSLEELTEIKLQFFKDGKIREMKNLILDFWKNPAGNFPTLERVSREFETSCPWQLSDEKLNIMIKYISLPSDTGHLKIDTVLHHLSNKTIITVEEASCHE